MGFFWVWLSDYIHGNLAFTSKNAQTHCMITCKDRKCLPGCYFIPWTPLVYMQPWSFKLTLSHGRLNTFRAGNIFHETLKIVLNNIMIKIKDTWYMKRVTRKQTLWSLSLSYRGCTHPSFGMTPTFREYDLWSQKTQILKSRCHTTGAHPSFGMTTTKTCNKVCFLVRRVICHWSVNSSKPRQGRCSI